MQERRHAEQHTGQNRHDDREQEDHWIQRDLTRSRDAVGIGCQHGPQAAEPCRGSKRSTKERQQDALGQELAQQASAACAERSPDGEFALARFRAS